MASENDRSDEQVYRDPDWVARQGHLHSNNVLFYFAQSPFFDQTSNNNTVVLQCRTPDQIEKVLATRELFEERLRKMSGIEYIVKYDPIQSQVVLDSPNGPEVSNIWVIHKRERRKRPAAEDEVNLLGVYYIVGDSIFMAPRVHRVVNNRMLSAVVSLEKMLSSASKLPTFTPTLGHTYTTAVSGPSTAARLSSQQLSKDSTPVPTSHAPSVRSGNAARSRGFSSAFSMSLSYRNEHMDDQPLIGEPGNFILGKTNAKVGHSGISTSQAIATTDRASLTPMPSLKTNIAAVTPKDVQEGENSPLSAREKPKRRKSKAAVTPAE
ncbi:MAG: hypothetical protein Q9227_003036 [Pyrenula ochraceoflavens]